MTLTARIGAAGLVVALGAGLVAPATAGAPSADRRAPRPMLTSASDHVVVGQKLVLKGAVAPATKGLTVILQKRVGEKGWVREARLTTTRNGGFTYRDKPHAVGERSYRAVVPGGGRSKPVTVTVFKWQRLTKLPIRTAAHTMLSGNQSINGRTYDWAVHNDPITDQTSGYADWNLARKCLKLRTTAGLGDASDSTATGTVSLSGDGTDLYTKAFSLGQSETRTLDLTDVFRLTFTWSKAGPQQTQVVLGEPEVLCAF